MTLGVLFVSIGLQGLGRLGRLTNSSVSINPKRVVPGDVEIMDSFREQQLLLQVVSDILPSQNGYQILFRT